MKFKADCATLLSGRLPIPEAWWRNCNTIPISSLNVMIAVRDGKLDADGDRHGNHAVVEDVGGGQQP